MATKTSNTIETNEDPNNLTQTANVTTDKPILTTKDELVTSIKDWLKMENDITKLKAELKEKNNKKKQITQTLVTVMKHNHIDCFDINDGALIYKKKKTKKTISGKFLLQQLEEYYKDNPELAKDITKHVLDNRIEVIKEDINIKRR
jgi:prolyl oligopeptidase PreP (S9A serine peptidase family)